MLGRSRFSEIELAGPAEYRRDFNDPSLAPVHHAVTTYDEFANVWRVSFGHDPARLRKCLEPLHRCHDSTYGQVRLERRVEGDVSADAFKIAKGLR